MPETLMILRSQQLGASTAAVLLLWAALHVVRSSASFAGGRLTDRIGASRTMWLGWLSYAAIAAGFAVATGAGRAWALFLAFGMVAGLTESPERALVAQFAGGHQGSGFGLYHGVTGLAALAGGIGLGAVFQAYGAGTATNAEVGAFLDSLELAGAPIAVSEMGATALGKPIYFVITSDPTVTSPGEAAASGKLVVYLQANIHGGEVEGKEAVLAVLR